tara:strand:- start:914 stop:1747 length:834 start_codon:yes stop_codon:yes gene_type:complete
MKLLKNIFVMCHYFHDDEKFKKIQGSISRKKFENLVKKNLSKKYIYTFDDCLKSQFYIAKPVLEKYNLKGLFFMNTFQLEKKYNYHEISKFFCNRFFKSFENYSIEFIKNFMLLNKNFRFNKKEIDKVKKKFPFYTDNEIKLRIVRTENFSTYNKILIKIFKSNKFNYKLFQKKIYMNKKEILDISKKHEIGLHTHTHPFDFHVLSKKKQYTEIFKNKKILENIIKKRITSFSYPVGNYKSNIFPILKKLKILSAFTNNSKNRNSIFEISRININKL